MKISCGREIADAATNAYSSVIEQKLQEYLSETGLQFSSKYMTVGVWANDILKQMSLFIRVAGQVKEWQVDAAGQSQTDWDVFEHEIMPALDYTENEDDEQKYDLLCEVLNCIYSFLTKEGYKVVRVCSR